MSYKASYKPKYAKTPAEGLERKQEFIRTSQDTKELSIRVASSMRDAVLVAVENPKFAKMTDDEKKEYILMWREWFFKKYSTNETAKELTEPF